MPNIPPRQTPQDDEFINDSDAHFWWSRTGHIVRWSLFLGILFLIFAFMGIGYWHAKRRMNKGVAPMRYHRWLLNRKQRARHEPNYRNPTVYYTTYQQGGGHYDMHAMPPPVYDASSPMPPVYQPPAGASKVDPSQRRAESTRRPATDDPSPSYEPPSGPPPGAGVRANHTGASTLSNNPYRLSN